jgi:hypothetical protein
VPSAVAVVASERLSESQFLKLRSTALWSPRLQGSFSSVLLGIYIWAGGLGLYQTHPLQIGKSNSGSDEEFPRGRSTQKSTRVLSDLHVRSAGTQFGQLKK